MAHRITALEARWDAVIPTLATKTDMAALGAEMRVELRDGLHQQSMAISALRTEMQQFFGEVRTEIQQVRTEMQKLSADIKTWTLATVLTIIGTMLAAIIGISQVQKATPPAPIVIAVPAAK